MLLRKEAAILTPLQLIQLPINWLDSLAELLQSLKTTEFHTVDALLAAVAGDDPIAGLMLKRILYWHGRMKDEFYLSQQDWWQQCRVTRKMVRRVKAEIFPLCGIAFEVRSTGRGRATHYGLRE